MLLLTAVNRKIERFRNAAIITFAENQPRKIKVPGVSFTICKFSVVCYENSQSLNRAKDIFFLRFINSANSGFVLPNVPFVMHQ